MKSGLAEPSRPSRWDALRSNNDAPSHSSSGSSGRRRQWNAPIPQTNHHNGSISSFSNGSSSLGSWGRRPHNNDFSRSFNYTWMTPRQTEEDGAIKRAIASLQNNDSSNADYIAELNIALFGSSDPTFLNGLVRSKDVDIKLPLYKVSLDKKWEAAYSILQFLSLHSTIQNCTHDHQFILGITKTASACLHLLSLQHDSVGTYSISDLRLCECISILLDNLQDNGSTTKNDDRNAILLCKSNLFQCIAKLLAVSTIHGRGAGKNNNTREGRRPLCSWGAETAVSRIIKDAALPILEGLEVDEALSDSMKSIYSHGGIECIYLLLLGTNDGELSPAIMIQPKAFQVSKHAVAMLAALVVDVMPDGKESQRANPLRGRILRALSACWRWACESIHSNRNDQIIQTAEVEMILRCMAVTFHTMHALERGIAQKQRSCSVDTSEINVAAIARDIKTLLTIEKLHTFQPQILRLLTSLCLAYSVATANQWHLFLDQTGSIHQPFLLSIVEEGAVALRRKDFDDASWILLPDVLQTITSLISSIPFTNWIGGDGRTSAQMSGGNFVCRVRNSMIALMTNLTNLSSTVKYNIMEGDNYSDDSHVELIMLQSAMLTGKLCISLPFNDSNNIFVAPAMTLVQCAGEIFVFSAKALESDRGNHTLLSSSMAHFSHVIATIRNENSSISAPVKHWLSDASSYDFIGILLNGSYSTLTLSSSSKCKLEILTSIAKLAPWSITREPFNLASFREICANLCNGQNDTERRLLGVKLIEAFIAGRTAYVIECSLEKLPHNMGELAVVPESFCPLLYSSLRDQSSAVRTCAVTSFGSLLVTDWAELLSHGTFIGDATSLDWTHVDSILSMCNPNGEESGSVRSAACKAVGDICKVCIGSLLSEEGLEKAVPFSDDFVVAISTKICSEMELALNDETASVRSMALFAIGNTALAMKDRCAFLSMNRMLPLIYACVVDKDDKVVGNAIRTIGHVSYFIYTPEFLSNEGGSVSDDLKLYCNLLSHLTGKIRDVLCDATGETSRELSWKQRNSAKKHAWGSATTIGMLLGYSHLLSHIDDSLVESALSQLYRCIQLHAFINEKIFAYAVKALSALPVSLWQYLSTKESDVIACGLATSFNFLELPQKKLSSSYQANIQKQANALIMVASKRDFCQMFLLRESLPFSIDFFYQWLVCSGDVPASKLEQVVDAVCSQEVQQAIDVTDIQILKSRTTQHTHLVQQQDAMQSAAANDDDEDEL